MFLTTRVAVHFGRPLPKKLADKGLFQEDGLPNHPVHFESLSEKEGTCCGGVICLRIHLFDGSFLADTFLVLSKFGGPQKWRFSLWPAFKPT